MSDPGRPRLLEYGDPDAPHRVLVDGGPALRRRRPVPPGARVHAGVRARIAADSGYARRIPADVVRDDAGGELH